MGKRSSRKMVERKKYQGVLNILSFNRHFYWIGLSSIVILMALKLAFSLITSLFLLGLSAILYGLTAPLIVSAYVYDFSGYYNFPWIDEHFNKSNTIKIANIHAGFDETSLVIEEKLPNALLQVYDFYDAQKHTESAIVRARKISQHHPSTELIKTNSIPNLDNHFDAVFLLSAAHEIRNNQEKIQFLKECKRVCKKDGQVFIVEHLRNLPNFIAFTVGFMHFFSNNTWMTCFKDAGFNGVTSFNFTPFLKIYQLKP